MIYLTLNHRDDTYILPCDKLFLINKHSDDGFVIERYYGDSVYHYRIHLEFDSYDFNFI